jgi:hypothetical protein
MLCLQYVTLLDHNERTKVLTQRKGRSPAARRRAPDERQDAGKNPTEKLRVRFSDGEAFGHFCVFLDKDHIPFGLAGFQTVIIAKKHLDHLSDVSADFYQRCLREGFIQQVAPTSLVGSRQLPTPQEAEKLLQQFAEEF